MFGYRKPDSEATVAAALAVVAVLAVAMVLAEAGGEDLRRAWALNGARVMAGEVWRLGTAHLVNLSPRHTFQNLLGLGLIVATLWPVLTARGLIRSVLASALSISLGMVLLQPEGRSYVGFSGITHGVLIYGGLVMLRAGPVWFGRVVLGCTALKLGWELTMGAVPSAAEAIGGEVSLLSHSLGALGGALVAPGPARWRGGAVILCALSVVPNTLNLRAAPPPEAVAAPGADLPSDPGTGPAGSPGFRAGSVPATGRAPAAPADPGR